MPETLVMSARTVRIIWGEDSRYWKMVDLENSRFSSEAELIKVCWLQIDGTLDTAVLDNNTTYSVVYMFRHKKSVAGLDSPAKISLTQKDGSTISSRDVYLYPRSPDLIPQEGQKWLAVEAGRFTPSGVTRDITFKLLDGTTHWKTGLIFGGVEIRAVYGQRGST